MAGEPGRSPGPTLRDARTILVIRHRAGGDLLLTTPALRALRAAAPSARIDVLASRGMGEILEGNPDVDRVIEFDRKSLRSGLALYARLARGGYDAVLDLVSNPRSAFLTRLTRARVRIGYDIAGRRGAYTLRVPREPTAADGRPVIRYAPEAALDQLRAAGIEPRGLDLTFHVSSEARAASDRWLASPEARRDESLPIVACLPTGSWPAKTWAPERFAEAMDALAGEATILWIWGPGERKAVESARAAMRAPSLFAPPTGWQELGALLARCAVLVSNDSGPKHIAVALGVPTVTIFGPTHPGTWHPPSGPHTALIADGLDCLHCNANVCPLPGDRHMRCMRDVGAARAADAARALLHEGTARRGRAAGEATCASR
jgi:ADP-heptose:LPS heptosyltransferase